MTFRIASTLAALSLFLGAAAAAQVPTDTDTDTNDQKVATASLAASAFLPAIALHVAPLGQNGQVNDPPPVTATSVGQKATATVDVEAVGCTISAGGEAELAARATHTPSVSSGLKGQVCGIVLTAKGCPQGQLVDVEVTAEAVFDFEALVSGVAPMADADVIARFEALGARLEIDVDFETRYQVPTSQPVGPGTSTPLATPQVTPTVDGLFLSDNGGTTWRQLTPTRAFDVAWDGDILVALDLSNAATPRTVTRTVSQDTSVLCGSPTFFVGFTSLGLEVRAEQLAQATTVALDAAANVDLAWTARLR